MRCGWVKISKPSSRAMATSVMPAASAVLSRALSAPIPRRSAARRSPPSSAPFRPRPGWSAAPCRMTGDASARASAPHELVERIVAADIFPQGDKAAVAPPEGRGMHGAGLPVEVLARSQARASARMMSAGGRRRGFRPRAARGRIASARLSMPHRPQPVGPAMMPPPLGERSVTRRGEPHAQFDAGAVVVDDLLDDIDLGSRPAR